ncbi:MAG: NAD(+)/NADH kinase [Candidatus Margulisiibacteriota bacterium]
MFNSVYILFRHNFSEPEQQKIKTMLTEAFPDIQLLNRPDEKTGLVLCVGGDGTFLRGVEARVNKKTPVLGVNVGGHLGYLTSETDFKKALSYLQSGQYAIVERTMVAADISCNGKTNAHIEAINEIVIRGENNKPIEVDVLISGSIVEDVFGDGLLISTPAGSTAYNLSAGGPLIDPDCQNLIITPIAPIDLNFRPVVIPDNKHILLKFEVRQNEHKYAFADRQEIVLEKGTYQVEVQKAATSLRLIEFPDAKGNFFQILHERTLGHRSDK